MQTELTAPVEGLTARGNALPLWCRSVPAGRRIFFLALFLPFFWSGQIQAATNYYNPNYEAPPLRTGSIQWLEAQGKMKERQELYRKRLPIPDAVGSNVPRAAELAAAGRAKSSAPLAEASNTVLEILLRILLFVVVALGAGLFLFHKLAPDVLARLNERFNPWFSEPLPEIAFTEKVRSEEGAFAEFAAKFRASSPLALSTGLTRTESEVQEFYGQAAKLLSHHRALLRDIFREMDVPARQNLLSALRVRMSEIKELADFPEVLPVWQAAYAVEGLLGQLVERIADVTPSTLRTVAGGVGLLEDLCAAALQPHLLASRSLKFLVVDDDLLGRLALSHSLKKAFTRPDLVTDGSAAMDSVRCQAYDVIFLDVQMPDMDGFELCMQIRESALNRTTPVVFVTSHHDFEARVQSTISGGNELMGKPFLTFEITVKALTLGMQGRLLAHQRAAGRIGESAIPLPVPAGRERVITGPSGSVWLAQSLPPSDRAAALTEVFLVRAARQMKSLREFCQKIHLAADEAARQALLADGFLLVNSLNMEAASPAVHPACQISVALEGLLRKLLEDPGHFSPSTSAAITQAVELLGDLFAPQVRADAGRNQPIELLVVDDDLVARRVIVGALQTAFSRPESVENGEAALALAAQRSFDVIFLDVVMPGMNGFQVCAKIRETAANRDTPVMFVTAKNDLDSQSEMRRVRGDDIVNKPFLVPEIILKTLTLALSGRLQRQNYTRA